MASTYTTGQSPRRDCLPPPLYILMAHLIDETDEYFSMSAPADGLALEAAFVHRDTGEVARQTVINLPPDAKVHLFKSPWEGWYYIAQRSNYYQKYGCSCRLRFCDHVRFLQKQEAAQ